MYTIFFYIIFFFPVIITLYISQKVPTLLRIEWLCITPPWLNDSHACSLICFIYTFFFLFRVGTSNYNFSIPTVRDVKNTIISTIIPITVYKSPFILAKKKKKNYLSNGIIRIIYQRTNILFAIYKNFEKKNNK